MRKADLLIALALAASGSVALAENSKVPPLPQPPPYGAYFLDNVRQSREEYGAALDAIAKHYGYANPDQAYSACLKTKFVMHCSGDIVAHRRDESPEVAKYGFKSWREAVAACVKDRRARVGPIYHCSADPFLALRTRP